MISCSFFLSVQVLVRLVGADDHMYSDTVDVMQWLTDSSLLEMIVDKLNPSVSTTLYTIHLVSYVSINCAF